MIEKTAWDVRKYPEKFAVYRILCNFAVVFQNCINSMEAKYIHRELSAVIEEAYRYFSVHYGNRTAPVRKDDAAPQLVLIPTVLLVGKS